MFSNKSNLSPRWLISIICGLEWVEASDCKPDRLTIAHNSAIKRIMIILCQTCGKSIETAFKRTKFCSRECRTTNWCNKNGIKAQFPHLGSGTVGTINELRVAVDLLSKGYEVFRSVGANCSCDFAILKNKKLQRIEVKTGYRNLNGSLLFGKGKNENFDSMAIVLPEEIIYKPEF